MFPPRGGTVPTSLPLRAEQNRRPASSAHPRICWGHRAPPPLDYREPAAVSPSPGHPCTPLQSRDLLHHAGMLEAGGEAGRTDGHRGGKAPQGGTAALAAAQPTARRKSQATGKGMGGEASHSCHVRTAHASPVHPHHTLQMTSASLCQGKLRHRALHHPLHVQARSAPWGGGREGGTWESQ